MVTASCDKGQDYWRHLDAGRWGLSGSIAEPTRLMFDRIPYIQWQGRRKRSSASKPQVSLRGEMPSRRNGAHRRSTRRRGARAQAASGDDRWGRVSVGSGAKGWQKNDQAFLRCRRFRASPSQWRRAVLGFGPTLGKPLLVILGVNAGAARVGCVVSRLATAGWQAHGQSEPICWPVRWHLRAHALLCAACSRSKITQGRSLFGRQRAACSIAATGRGFPPLAEGGSLPVMGRSLSGGSAGDHISGSGWGLLPKAVRSATNLRCGQRWSGKPYPALSRAPDKIGHAGSGPSTSVRSGAKLRSPAHVSRWVWWKRTSDHILIYRSSPSASTMSSAHASWGVGRVLFGRRDHSAPGRGLCYHVSPTPKKHRPARTGAYPPGCRDPRHSTAVGGVIPSGATPPEWRSDRPNAPAAIHQFLRW